MGKKRTRSRVESALERASLQSRMNPRWFEGGDLEEILWITQTSYADPLERSELETLIKSTGSIVRVVAIDERVVGFVLYRQSETRDGLDILELAVHSEYRRIGVGRMLVGLAWSRLATKNFLRTLTVVVRESTLFAHCFFRELGFKAVKTLRNHFPNTGEDGYVFVRRRDDLPSPSPAGKSGRRKASS